MLPAISQMSQTYPIIDDHLDSTDTMPNLPTIQPQGCFFLFSFIYFEQVTEKNDPCQGIFDGNQTTNSYCPLSTKMPLYPLYKWDMLFCPEWTKLTTSCVQKSR
ncbi:hypothetical protein AAHE18_08G030500 [Arachis hypogaea]|nr:uncharacterized protein DS421_8g226870 [Arachis hypogaea]